MQRCRAVQTLQGGHVTAKQASTSYEGRFQRMDMYLSVLMICLSAYVFVHALSLKHKVQTALQKASCREFSAYFHGMVPKLGLRKVSL